MKNSKPNDKKVHYINVMTLSFNERYSAINNKLIDTKSKI